MLFLCAEGTQYHWISLVQKRGCYSTWEYQVSCIEDPATCVWESNVSSNIFIAVVAGFIWLSGIVRTRLWAISVLSLVVGVSNIMQTPTTIYYSVSCDKNNHNSFRCIRIRVHLRSTCWPQIQKNFGDCNMNMFLPFMKLEFWLLSYSLQQALTVPQRFRNEWWSAYLKQSCPWFDSVFPPKKRNHSDADVDPHLYHIFRGSKVKNTQKQQ